MPEKLIASSTYQSADAIVDASEWWELKEDQLGLVRRYLEHGFRDAAMYVLALQEHPEVIPSGFSMTDLVIGAICHDIAKPWINGEDALLWDKSDLTSVERDIIKTHPEASYRLLKNVMDKGVVVPAVAFVIALFHHERLDGTGYPRGLSGDLIPDYVQMFSVVDYVVGMAEQRTYRERGMTISEIETYLTKNMMAKLNQAHVRSVLNVIYQGKHLNVSELEDLESLRI